MNYSDAAIGFIGGMSAAFVLFVIIGLTIAIYGNKRKNKIDSGGPGDALPKSD